MKKLTLFLLLVLGCVTSIAFGQNEHDSTIVPVPLVKFDWLLKRNADAERSEAEVKNCDSVNVAQGREALKLREAIRYNNTALEQKQVIRTNDSIEINSQQLKITKLNKKVSLKNSFIIAESVFIALVVLVVYMLKR